jgi:hypothetical protein
MAREDQHFRLRIPDALKVRVETAAEKNHRSMTAEIVARLEASFVIDDMPEIDVSVGREMMVPMLAAVREEIEAIVGPRVRQMEGLVQQVRDAIAAGRLTDDQAAKIEAKAEEIGKRVKGDRFVLGPVDDNGAGQRLIPTAEEARPAAERSPKEAVERRSAPVKEQLRGGRLRPSSKRQ